MTINFIMLILTWLLSETVSKAVSIAQNQSFAEVTTGKITKKNLIHDQRTSQEMSSLYPLSDVLDHTTAPSVLVDVNTTKEKTSTEVSLQTTQTMSSKKKLMNIQRAATPTSLGVSQLNNSTGIKTTTEEKSQVKTSTTAVAFRASNPTKPTRLPAIMSNFTQTKGTKGTSISQFVKDKITHPSKQPTQPTQSTNVIPTATTSIKPEEDKSESTITVMDGDAVQPTGLYKTSMATPFIHITKVKKRQEKKEEIFNNGRHHSKAVAGLIGGALVLMMVGFLVIYIKKRKLQKQQITTTDWAGPSPFLEGGADNDQVTLRSSTRISLSSFLPHRLSKRLSMLPETDKELEDLTSGTTFGGKHQESTFGRGVDGNHVQQSNESPEIKSIADTIENSVLVTSLQTNDTLSTNKNLDVANLSQDYFANPSDLSGAVENDQAQRNNGFGQL